MIQVSELNFEKLGGLIPVCVQDFETGQVLMIGFMNKEALETTLDIGRVTFYSRSKERLWTKGETSGNFLEVVEIAKDCDNDSLLIMAKPKGSTCHTGDMSCFKTKEEPVAYWIFNLIKVIEEKKLSKEEGSYTASLFDSGIKRIAQKVGEEGLEVALAGVSGDRVEVISESVDLLYHLFVLWNERGVSIGNIGKEIKERRKG